MNQLFIISGPSGAGKSSVVKAIRARHTDDLLFCVSVTTRAPRAGERNGVDYEFVDEKRFQELLRQGAFVEHVRRRNSDYGTPWAQLDRIQQGHLILDVDTTGALAIRDRYPDSCLIFIAPPSLQELERRLRGRGDDVSEDEIQSRLQKAGAELALSSEYNHIVVNERLEDTVSQVLSIIRDATGG